MRLIEADALKEILDKIPARSIENANGRAYVLIRLSTVFEIIKQMPSAEPEPKPIEYNDCVCALMKMCMDNVLTDGEYNKIMDKLNAKHRGE